MEENRREMPVAVFDSGVGGISVLRELVRQMPGEDFLFRGDSAHAPYGTKPAAEILRLTTENIAQMAEDGIKGIVIACNTATSAAITPVRQIYTDIPVVGIEPAIKPAVKSRPGAKVLVMATPMTVKGEKFLRLVHRFEEEGTIIPLACPGLMEFVEAGKLSGPEIGAYLSDLLGPYRDSGIDAVVLGCTHYPFVRRQVAKVMGEGVLIVDGSEGTAREMKRRLGEAGLLRDRTQGGTVKFEESIPEKADLCRYLLEAEI